MSSRVSLRGKNGARGKPTGAPALRRFFAADRFDGDGVRGFAAKVFGAVYEDLLGHAFKKQRNAKVDYETLHWAGEVWVRKPGAARDTKVDFLLKRPGNSKLICFEAKCWPGYGRYHKLTARDAHLFAKHLWKFGEYVRMTDWKIREPDGKKEAWKTARTFGVIVFDYEKADRKRILATLSHQLGAKITEIESICDLLDTTIRYKTIRDKDPDLRRDLQTKLGAANELLKMFVA